MNETLLTALWAGQPLSEVPRTPCALELSGEPNPGVRRIEAVPA